jgi:hypothetical protein
MRSVHNGQSLNTYVMYRVAEKSPYTRTFFPVQQWRSSWLSLIKPFPERSHHFGTWFVPCAVSRAPTHLPPSAPRQSNCFVSAIRKNTTKFCGCGKSRVHYLAHCSQPTILHCTACCAVQCKLILSLRCVLSGCTVTSRPLCRVPPNNLRHSQIFCSSYLLTK